MSNSLIVLRAFLLNQPEPKNFKGASFPGIVSIKKPPINWDSSGNIYFVIGLELAVGQKNNNKVLRSGIAVIKTNTLGEYISMEMGTYDFTNFNTVKMTDLVSELILQNN